MQHELRAADQYASTTLGGALASKGEPATIHGVIGTLEVAHGFLMESARLAEQIADALSGSAPTSDGASGAKTSPGCLVEHLADHVSGLRHPAVRIQDALRRIERRIG